MSLYKQLEIYERGMSRKTLDRLIVLNIVAMAICACHAFFI